MGYKSKHTGSQIDEAVSKVLNGEITSNWNANEGEPGYIENKPNLDFPFENGESENSAVLRGGNNIAGLKGWYYKAIQFNIDKKYIYLYLTETQQIPNLVTKASEVNEPEVNITFNLSINDVVSIINDVKYDNQFKLVANEISKYGRITLTPISGGLPFTEVKVDDELTSGNFDSEDYAIYSVNNPLAGISDMGDLSFAVGLDNKATNNKAAAFGYNNHSYGKFSFTEGRDNKAGYCSHAEGKGTYAGGLYSHTEGAGTQAIGDMSHAEGKSAITTGKCSHAEGRDTQAIGANSHAEGQKTQAIGVNSHAEGNKVVAIGVNSHAEGYSNDVTEYITLHSISEEDNIFCNYSADDIFIHTSDIINKIGISAYGKIYTLISYFNKIDGEITSKDIYTTGIVDKPTTPGNLDEVNINIVRNHNDVIYFDTVLVPSYNTDGENYNMNVYVDVILTAEGTELTLPSFIDSNMNGIVLRDYIENAIGDYSHTEGWNTVAKKTAGHAEGVRTLAKGSASHAEGIDTEASGRASHAEGELTKATTLSHAEGFGSSAEAECSHVEGYNCITKGKGSHAEGSSTITYNFAEHACGIYNNSNKSDTDESKKTLFSIGIGTSDTNRKNAFEVKGNGDIYIWVNNQRYKLQDLLSSLI